MPNKSNVDTGLNVAIDLSHENQGQIIAITYTVTNNSGAEKTFDLATGGDIQIGADDFAPVTSLSGDTGFKMVPETMLTKIARTNLRSLMHS